tara:strand:- start:643 stop:1008 length:366 start_codon:yes stop_codon:yes gene_type:complete
MKKLLLLLAVTYFTVGCSREADIASRNLSLAAGEFKVVRRIVFYNGITGKYILSIKGLCSVAHNSMLAVTCKTGSGYKKHYLGLSDNVTYFAEQLESKNLNPDQYTVVFRPLSILPDVRVK